MKRARRETCTTCGQDDVAHYNGEPHGNHVKNARHQNALRAAEPHSSDGAAHPEILGVAGEHGGGHAP